MKNKIKEIIEQLIKFGVVGVISTVISTGINIIFLKTGMAYLLAYTLAYGIGIIISYFLNSILVFKNELSIAKFVKFASVYVVSYFIGLINIMIMVELLGVKDIYATIINVCIMTFLNFIFVKFIAFSKKKDK